MRFKIGDKVKFINENGGGVVIKIIDSRLVNIKTDDGFEMPVISSDLMPDYRAMEAELPKQNMVSPAFIPPAVQEDEPDMVSEINPWGKVKEEKGIYLAFEPHEQQWILTGDIDVILLNNTSDEVLYSLFLKRNNVLEGVDFNSVPANSKIVIDTVSREDLDNWISGYLQILFHNDVPKKIYLPVHSAIDIKIGRFFKEGSYRSSSLLNTKAIIVTIITQNAMSLVTDNVADRKQDAQISINKSQVVKKAQLIDKYRTAPGEAEVDLHIGEVVDNILGLSSMDMLKIQVDTFKKVLESAISNDYQKVIFIHGVGNGVLKNAIIKDLENYEGTENSMASISKFGVGALDVSINNK